ncbi:MAG: universal stress protein [Flavobacteriales bacterium]|nr:universal stress protein [Flavobacteriales bacterium]MBP6641488.1 universal stress protein [Flavobacteriales bacterium]MBP7154749.1 universal stress protein [Flavobacteriales bacterium]HQV73951.1 universal stress protein [Flavobacteriales bacterium]HQW39620.1 universal stress protein [Flavobacteriales bacterium]
MTQKADKILVPTDFTKVADCAMNHAMTVAGSTGAAVFLLHVVDKASVAEEARVKLGLEAERARKWNNKVSVTPIVRVGSIYDEIGDAAAEEGAGLIIMGTHGMRGMQFLTGSRALRVIMGSSVPFIVVQERKIKESGYNDIVVPLDLHKETRQKLTIVAQMAQTFKSKVHLITPKEDDEFLHKQLVNNITFAENYLRERNIEHEATIADSDSGDFVKAVVKYANGIDADLITIMNLTEGNIFGILGVPYEQEIIANEAMIPVMCMKPIETGVNSGWTMQG